MDNDRLTRLPANVGSLGIGGAIGSATGLGVYFLVPSMSGEVSIHVAVSLGGTVGGAIGAAVHTFLAPLVRKIGHYVLMLELDFQVYVGWLTPEDRAMLRAVLQTRHFAGSGNPANQIGLFRVATVQPPIVGLMPTSAREPLRSAPRTSSERG